MGLLSNFLHFQDFFVAGIPAYKQRYRIYGFFQAAFGIPPGWSFTPPADDIPAELEVGDK